MSIAGKDTTFKHGTNGAVGALTDFTTKTRSLNTSFEAEEVDATVFGDGYRQFEQSFKNATITAQYKHDTTVFGQLTAIYNGADTVIWEIGPIGTTATNPQIEGSMVMTSLSLPYPVGDLMVIDVTWRVTGAVVFGTF